MSKPLATKVRTPLKWQCPNWAQSVNIFVATIIFLTLLGTEFTRASQVATGVLFHSSMMTSESWWMLETLHTSTFRFRTPRWCHFFSVVTWKDILKYLWNVKGCTHLCDTLYVFSGHPHTWQWSNMPLLFVLESFTQLHTCTIWIGPLGVPFGHLSL